jgi:hypothetical protein
MLTGASAAPAQIVLQHKRFSCCRLAVGPRSGTRAPSPDAEHAEAARLRSTPHEVGTLLDVAGNGRYARKVIIACKRERARRLHTAAPQELAALANSDPAVLTVSDEDMRRALESALTRLRDERCRGGTETAAAFTWHHTACITTARPLHIGSVMTTNFTCATRVTPIASGVSLDVQRSGEHTCRGSALAPPPSQPQQGLRRCRIRSRHVR